MKFSHTYTKKDQIFPFIHTIRWTTRHYAKCDKSGQDRQIPCKSHLYVEFRTKTKTQFTDTEKTDDCQSGGGGGGGGG